MVGLQLAMKDTSKMDEAIVVDVRGVRQELAVVESNSDNKIAILAGGGRIDMGSVSPKETIRKNAATKETLLDAELDLWLDAVKEADLPRSQCSEAATVSQADSAKSRRLSFVFFLASTPLSVLGMHGALVSRNYVT